ncbi:RagB/SusD family nutrient uptake outer membrane protein [Psychroserpens algicola]|uniref:RagB/SusD family nutrient uptake outer membrane protein n=1 Tax=Psychroserpens algicola TaxID=1719034 RepID=A0ABT0H615_9FLAO|nr:RagB/SusD family nutrient uptake outer membrane protein [Psychroserpens algicola]MCK8479822.1 RagB/SusD family nutrient uptake outer membrane protein [Psychroserpens algicola]
MSIKKITAFVLILACMSCEDYLEILPEGQENTENYFNSQSDYEDALVGVYDLLSTTYLHNLLGEIASDNSLCGGESPTDVLDWQQIDDMTHTPDNGALRSVFQFMYAGISRANYIVEFQDKTDFEGKDQILAENLFLRSYYYFELVKFFGDVPLYTESRISIEGSQSIDRTPKAEVYAQLEADLQTAIDNLPWQQGQSGRATKGAALALLGKIYLYQDKFEEAAITLDQVINSGQYQLVEDFGTIFLNSNENNIESVFEIQYFGGEGGGFDCFQCVEGNIAVGFMGPRFTGGNFSPFTSGFSFNPPTEELYNAYTTNDERRDATILNMDEFVAERPDVTFNLGNTIDYTGYYNKKYIPYAEANSGDVNLTHSNNYRAIRYSDVLLMAAEAFNRGGIDDTKARNYVNLVRVRAGLDEIQTSGANLTQDIYSERRLELAGEGHRFFDQVRTGQTNSIPNFSPKNVLFPIPRIEIELAGNRWEQNAGY